ncbi:MAG: ribonuclease H-like domain-containing protein, partial [Spirochaetales bacterium]|nr:ribonuclease H-like domain-containing protein [Spirochaetales bacterium]
MSPAGFLTGRLDRLRTSKINKKPPGSKSESITPLPLPWKLIRPFVSMKQEVFNSPLNKSSFKSDNPQLFPVMEYGNFENLIFYDLETTGLSGGAGTIAFLAGFGWIEKSRLIINQYFLHDFPGEIDFLLLINELLAPGKILVSYNGKSFDHPLLGTRFLMKGLKLHELPEIDLLHAARRLWKKRLPTCRLGTIESNILGIHRIDDVPGIEVPDIYFDYLKNGQETRLAGVFKHHLQDIKSLAGLLAHMEKLWSNP